MNNFNRISERLAELKLNYWNLLQIFMLISESIFTKVVIVSHF